MLNQGYVYRRTVASDDDGRSLLEYLSRNFGHSSGGEWLERIEEGRVRVEGLRAAPGARLRAGQTVTWHRPPWKEPDAPRDFTIAHEDTDLLVLAKPAGLPTLPGAGFLENSLASLARRVDPKATPMHRLGRWTSGLVLFARTGVARAQIAAAFRDGLLEKLYRCLAAGSPAEDRWTIDVPIGRIPYPPLGTLWAADPKGKPARSSVHVRRRHPDRFLADVRIDTGRPHQIRIHLAASGHPLQGDPLYASGGRPAPGTRALPGDPGYRLHALRLRFRHPTRDVWLDVRCDAPAELQVSTGD